MMDSRGEIWAATYGNGLNRLNPVTEKITHYHFNGKNFGDYDNPIALMEDSEGKIWVGGELAGGGFPFMAIIDPIAETIKKINLPEDGTFRVVTIPCQNLPLTTMLYLQFRMEELEFTFLKTMPSFFWT